MDRFVTITGCSGGGKSSLLAELGRRGYDVVEEPGRRIVAEEIARGGTALPWIDGEAFARRAIAMSLADRTAAESREGWVFFDRGLIDAAAALQHLAGGDWIERLGRAHRCNRRVFLAPPGPRSTSPIRSGGTASPRRSPSTGGCTPPISRSVTRSAFCRKRASRAVPSSC